MGGWVKGFGFGVKVDVNEELKFLRKFTHKKWGGGGVGADVNGEVKLCEI